MVDQPISPSTERKQYKLSMSTHPSDFLKSPTAKEHNISGHPIMSETRNLFNFFMLSRSDVKFIDAIYDSIEDKKSGTILISTFISYFKVPIEDNFNKQFINYIRTGNGNINYYAFVKFILYVSLLPELSLIKNIAAFLQKNAKAHQTNSLYLFLQFFGPNEIPESIVSLLQVRFETNNDLISSLELTKFNTDFHFIKDKFSKFKALFALVIPIYRKNAIINRVNNFIDYIYYYETNHSFIPLNICQRLNILVRRQENPNEFDFYMKYEARSSYLLPFLFEHAICYVRTGSQASSFHQNALNQDSKVIEDNLYRNSLLNNLPDNINDVNNKDNKRSGHHIKISRSTIVRNDNTEERITVSCHETGYEVNKSYTNNLKIQTIFSRGTSRRNLVRSPKITN